MDKKETKIIENVVKRADAMIEKLSVWIDEAKDIKATSLAQLQAQLEAEPKPLEHGDCGEDSCGYPILTIGNGKKSKTYYEDGKEVDMYLDETDGKYRHAKYLGNAFKHIADLQAIAKPIKSTGDIYDGSGRISAAISGYSIYVYASKAIYSIDTMTKFHALLGQVIAYAKLKA